MGSSGSKDKKSCLVESIADHADAINCMAVSDDGSLLVTGSEDKDLRMWSTKSNPVECLGVMKGHTGYVTCVTIFDTFVISGSADKTIRKWDMSNCDCLETYRDHKGRILKLICNGDFIFSSSTDKTVKVFLFDTSEIDSDDEEADEKFCVRSLEGHTRGVTPIIFIPREFGSAENFNKPEDDDLSFEVGDIMITGSADNTAKSWCLESAHCLQTFKGHTATVTCMAVDTKAKNLYTGSADTTIRSWNIERGECNKVMSGHEGPILCLTVMNKLLYSGSQDSTARCWVKEFGDCTRIYRGAKHSISIIKLFEGNLYCASGDTCIRAFDAKSGALKRLFQGHANAVVAVVVMRGRMFSGSTDGTLRVWDISKINSIDNKDEDDDDKLSDEDIQQC